MIRNRQDLAYYLGSDAISSKKPNPLVKGKMPLKKKLRAWIVQNRNLPWELLIALRKLEFFSRMGYGKPLLKKLPYKLCTLYWQRRMLALRRKTNIIVESKQLGAGAYIPYNNVVITSLATIGENCLIESGVTIGITGGKMVGPRIGNNVFIGTGAKILGDIDIADGICIGANAVVTKSFTTPGVTIAGVPARQISDKGSAGMLVKGAEIWRKQHAGGIK